MYKSWRIMKVRVAINKFPKTAKEVSRVYHSGIRVWEADINRNYSVVVGTFRVIISSDKEHRDCCGSL